MVPPDLADIYTSNILVTFINLLNEVFENSKSLLIGLTYLRESSKVINNLDLLFAICFCSSKFVQAKLYNGSAGALLAISFFKKH